MWAGLEGLCGCQVGRSRSFLRFTDLALVATVEICLDSWLRLCVVSDSKQRRSKTYVLLSSLAEAMAVSKNAAGYSGLTEDEEKQLKALLNKAQQAPKASGGSAMTDASKRLRGESDSDFEAVGSPTTPSELFRSEDRKEVPLPKNCTLKEWSHMVCQLPKVNGEPKWNGKTYSELLRMAIDGDIELDKYPGFIFKKYHGSYDGTHKSQAVDLAGFLLYMEFDPEREPAGSWKRVVKP